MRSWSLPESVASVRSSSHFMKFCISSYPFCSCLLCLYPCEQVKTFVVLSHRLIETADLSPWCHSGSCPSSQDITSSDTALSLQPPSQLFPFLVQSHYSMVVPPQLSEADNKGFSILPATSGHFVKSVSQWAELLETAGLFLVLPSYVFFLSLQGTT